MHNKSQSLYSTPRHLDALLTNVLHNAHEDPRGWRAARVASHMLRKWWIADDVTLTKKHALVDAIRNTDIFKLVQEKLLEKRGPRAVSPGETEVDEQHDRRHEDVMEALLVQRAGVWRAHSALAPELWTLYSLAAIPEKILGKRDRALLGGWDESSQVLRTGREFTAVALRAGWHDASQQEGGGGRG